MRAAQKWLAALLLAVAPAVVQAAPAKSTMAKPAAVASPASSTSVASASAGVVNINDASPAELERLPGVGKVRALQIVEHRRTHPFHKVDELTHVKGFGRKTFGRLRPYLAISGATTLHQRPAKLPRAK